jgi:hypothetical protein
MEIMAGAPWMQDQRDPVSKWFDAAALRYLERVYAAGGEWTGIYLAPPAAAQRARLEAAGIDPMERDRWGEYRWVRAFKRAVYFNLKKYGYADGMRPGVMRASAWPAKSLEWETGKRVMRAGWPARRWAIRARLHPTGEPARKAAAEKVPDRLRWIDKTGHVTDRQSTVADRF